MSPSGDLIICSERPDMTAYGLYPVPDAVQKCDFDIASTAVEAMLN